MIKDILIKSIINTPTGEQVVNYIYLQNIIWNDAMLTIKTLLDTVTKPNNNIVNTISFINESINKLKETIEYEHMIDDEMFNINIVNDDFLTDLDMDNTECITIEWHFENNKIDKSKTIIHNIERIFDQCYTHNNNFNKIIKELMICNDKIMIYPTDESVTHTNIKSFKNLYSDCFSCREPFIQTWLYSPKSNVLLDITTYEC